MIHIQKKRFFTSIWVIAQFVLASSLLAQSADVFNMKTSLEENRQYLRYLDLCLSNLDDDIEIKQDMVQRFETAMRFDYYAKLWYMEGDFGKSKREMNDSRREMQEVYMKILEVYMDRVEVLLDLAAPQIVKSGDRDAHFYLQKAHSSLKEAKTHYEKGRHVPILLYTEQLFYFREGLSDARMAGRYGLLALVEPHIAREEKERYQVVMLDDARGDGYERGSKNAYEILENHLRSLADRKLITPVVQSEHEGKSFTINLFYMNEDNYGHYIPGKKSLYLEISGRLSSKGIHEKDRMRMPGDP
jgi:hypothetical protein